MLKKSKDNESLNDREKQIKKIAENLNIEKYFIKRINTYQKLNSTELTIAKHWLQHKNDRAQEFKTVSSRIFTIVTILIAFVSLSDFQNLPIKNQSYVVISLSSLLLCCIVLLLISYFFCYGVSKNLRAVEYVEEIRQKGYDDIMLSKEITKVTK